MRNYLVGLDVGTTGCKACIFDIDGNLIVSDYVEYEIITDQEHPGYVEQDQDAITESLFKCVKNALDKSNIDKNDILALGLSTVGASIGYCDEDGNTIGNWIVWQDMRGFEVVDELEKGMNTLTYMKETNNVQIGYSSLAKQIWMQKYKPEVVRQAAHVANPQEFFLRKFGCKEWVSDAASVCRESTANLNDHYYSKKVFDAYGLDMSKRGKRVPNGTVVATVTDEIADKTGLPVGCKICVGGMDQCCSPFGSGMYRNGDTVVTIGTIGCVYVCSDKLYNIPGSTLTWKSHMYFDEGPKNYTAEMMSFASASAYRWLRDTICTHEMIQSLESDKNVYEILNELINSSAPGANGVTFLPFLQGRSYCPPDEFATGAFNGHLSTATFTGMRMSTTRADIVRAVAEGVLYEIRDMLDILEENGMPPGNIVVNGGVTKSPYWCQMMADIWQVPVRTVDVVENGCLGAAMFAGIGVGVYNDPEDAVKHTIRDKDIYYPDKSLKEVYDTGFERFRRIYMAMEESTGEMVKGPLAQRAFLHPYVKVYGKRIREKVRKDYEGK